MAGAGKYTAETLAFRAGVPLRTVRFYVQEKLIDPPLGRGRGAHFTDFTEAQLQRERGRFTMPASRSTPSASVAARSALGCRRW